MDGVSAFVNGLHWFINVLAAGFAGIIVMSVSAVLFFSHKPVRLAVPVLAVIGTILLLPAASAFVVSGFKEGTVRGIVTGVIFLILAALIVFYDITVIRKYLKQKKNTVPSEKTDRTGL